MHKSSEEFEMWHDSTTIAELGALKRWKKTHRITMGKNGVATFSQLF